MKTVGFCVVNQKYHKQLDVLLSCLKNCTGFDFIVFSDDDLGMKTQKIPKTGIHFTSNTEYDRVMDIVLSKIKIFSDLSKQYDQVFNVDVDILILKDIKPVLDKYNEPYLYGCLEDVNYIKLYERRKKILKYIGITEKQYINAGFMILNFPFEFNRSDVEYFFRCCPYSNCPEQDFLNWKFKDKIKVMPNYISWNRFLPFETSPYMVHFLGRPKPWETNNSVDIYYEKYMKYFKNIKENKQ